MSHPTTPVGTIILGASGYVAGELLRWIAGHPTLDLLGAVSKSHGGAPIADSFPHLSLAFPDDRFVSPEDVPALLRRGAGSAGRIAALSAAPHTASAPQIAALLEAADAVGIEVPVVDLSADFRHPDPETFERIYGVPHPTPDLLPTFRSGLPEFEAGDTTGIRIGHPGCFASAVALAAAPLCRTGRVGPEIHVAAITGSTGSGGSPKPTTHHPFRHANLYTYKALSHRHAPEMEDMLQPPGGARPRVRFVPHSGPFARGIHATAFLRPTSPMSNDALDALYRDFYAEAPLVRVADPPRLKETVGSAAAVVGARTDGETIVAMSAIDNLGKGAASGGVQWMNRLLGLPDDAGLTTPPPGWL